MSKKKITIFTSAQGHESISTSIEQKIKNKYQVSTYFHPLPLDSAYVFLYQFLPGATQIAFNLSNNKTISDNLNKFFGSSFKKDLEEYYQKNKPDLIISTFWSFIPAMEHLQKEFGVPFINVIPDPLTVYMPSISKTAQANLAFDQNTILNAQKYYPQANYVKSGWWVRKEFEQKYQINKVRQELNLDPDKLTFLIASGSQGTNLVAKIIPELITNKNDLQVVIACGKNKKLLQAIKSLGALLNRGKTNSKLIPLGYTTQMHKYMQAADLVIGKAGPNTLFESTATETPFFAITHISGQEDGNLEIIDNYQLGYVEENMRKAQKLLAQITDHPDELNKFKKPLQKMNQYNQKSTDVVLSEIKKLI